MMAETKYSIWLMLCFLLPSSPLPSQRLSESFQNNLVKKLTQDIPDSSWKVFTREGQIVLQYCSTFMVIPNGYEHDANYQASKPDMIEWVVRLEEGRTDKKESSVGKKNRTLIRPLKRKAWMVYKKSNEKK